MNKIIIIDEKKKFKPKRIINHKLFELLLYMIGYAIVLITVSTIFNNTFYINSDY